MVVTFDKCGSLSIVLSNLVELKWFKFIDNSPLTCDYWIPLDQWLEVCGCNTWQVYVFVYCMLQSGNEAGRLAVVVSDGAAAGAGVGVSAVAAGRSRAEETGAAWGPAGQQRPRQLSRDDSLMICRLRDQVCCSTYRKIPTQSHPKLRPAKTAVEISPRMLII